MLKKSIRWRLALSFAAIALLAAGALGAVLLMTVRDYYARQERNYLVDNVETLRDILGFALFDEAVSTDALRAQLDGFAFLSQSRVRFLDTDEHVVVDTGTPDPRIYLALDTPQDVIFSMAAPSETALSDPALGRTVAVTVSRSAPVSETNVVLVSSFTAPVSGSTVVSGTDVQPGTFFRLVRQTDGTAPFTADWSSPLVSTFYGFAGGADADALDSRWRSNQVVREPVSNIDGGLIGYVEVSESPAYGIPILISVARAWALASVVAVLLAAVVGWGMSRNLSAPLVTLTTVTARMASGDLTSRAPVTGRTDEVGVLARSFNQMADRVEETVTALREFVSDAAHELHTPLTALHTNLELAGDADVILRAQAQVARLEALTEGLLDLSRIEAGIRVFAPVDIAALAHETAELYASEAEQADVTFTIDTIETPALVTGDEAQLRRVLLNLLDNALKFTPAGGAVHFALDIAEHVVVIRVIDTGIGVPPEDLPYLFNRFHRGRNTADYPGSGLGLAIVRAIVEWHGGQVQAENTADGACFTVRLPV